MHALSLVQSAVQKNVDFRACPGHPCFKIRGGCRNSHCNKESECPSVVEIHSDIHFSIKMDGNLKPSIPMNAGTSTIHSTKVDVRIHFVLQKVNVRIHVL